MNPPLHVTARPLLRHHRRAAGFTLVELVMVIVLVGILAVVVVPRLGLLGGFNQAGFRDKVVGTLQFARKTAMAQRRNVQVTLALNALTLRIANATNDAGAAGAFPRDLNLPAPDPACGGAILNRVCAPNNVVLLGNGAPGLVVTFTPLGDAAPAAVFTVTGANAITVEASGYVR